MKPHTMKLIKITIFRTKEKSRKCGLPKIWPSEVWGYSKCTFIVPVSVVSVSSELKKQTS